MSDEVFDVAVCGAGPAGSAAATLLAGQNHRVALIEAQPLPRSSGACVWLGAKLVPLLDELGVSIKAMKACAFGKAVFHNGDLTKQATPAFTKAPGYLVNRGHLDTALTGAAVKAGAELFAGAPVRDIQLGEASATLSQIDGTEFTSKLVLLAAGRGTPLAQRCGFGQTPSAPVLWSARVDSPVGHRHAKPKAVVHVVLGLDRTGSFGTICRLEDQVSISIHSAGARDDVTAGFINLCKTAYEQGLVDVDLARQAATAPVLGSPASAALEMDSHVGKHALLIGDAGGFVSAASNEGIFPAMWSAKIAAQVIHEALQTPYTQDVLMTYDSKWRIEMADHLRSPNTDTQFLLPLVFSNQAMADRMGTAFFSGENI